MRTIYIHVSYRIYSNQYVYNIIYNFQFGILFNMHSEFALSCFSLFSFSQSLSLYFTNLIQSHFSMPSPSHGYDLFDFFSMLSLSYTISGFFFFALPSLSLPFYFFFCFVFALSPLVEKQNEKKKR